MSERIVVLGEALTDCVKRVGDSSVLEVPGGSPMNVAIGLGRLGHDVLLGARWGSDERGSALASHVANSGVSVIEQASGLEKTSTATAVLSTDGSADYVFDLVWDLEPDMVPSSGYLHVHTGSIGATLKPGAKAVWDIVDRERRLGASVSYDPNARPQIMGDKDLVLDQVKAMVALSDVVKASDEDIEWLYPGQEIPDVVAQWQELGVALVVITTGKDGVTGYAGDQVVSLPTRATTVIDTIGAGDSLMSGLISALAARSLLGAKNHDAVAGLSAEDLTDILEYSLKSAAITVSRPGADPPWLAELV
jgi:fructokinase